MCEFISLLALIIGVGAFINGEKLRKRLNLTQDLLVKNSLVKGNDFIPGWREKEEASKNSMTEEEREIGKIVEKMVK